MAMTEARAAKLASDIARTAGYGFGNMPLRQRQEKIMDILRDYGIVQKKDIMAAYSCEGQMDLARDFPEYAPAYSPDDPDADVEGWDYDEMDV